MAASRTSFKNKSVASASAKWQIFDPSNSLSTYTLIAEPQPVVRKPAAKLPGLKKLNARLAASESGALARAEESAMRLIGRKQI